MNENYNRANSLLEDISSRWNTDDVVALLKKNGLIECCAAIVKRRVDGKALLSLTEQNFNSWKNDLTISSFWNLHRFAVELKGNPENYLLFKENGSTSSSVLNSDAFSDSDPWDTDFDDDEDTSTSNTNHQRILKPAGDNCFDEKVEKQEGEEGEEEEEEEDANHGREMQYWQNKSRLQKSQAPPNISGFKKPAAYLKRRQEEEEVKTEEEEEDEDENYYANGIVLNEPSLSQVSAARSKFESVDRPAGGANLTKLLQEQLRLREVKNKPTICPKPQPVEQKNQQIKTSPKPPMNGNKSFLNSHTVSKNWKSSQESTQSSVAAMSSELLHRNSSLKAVKKPEENPPAPPKPKIVSQFSVSPIRNLPKPPPLNMGKLDLLADLPRPDKNADKNFSITRVNSAQSLASTRSFRNSIESVYPPHSVSSVDEEDVEEEEGDTTYESINEMPVLLKSAPNDDYLQPIKPSVPKFPQPRTIKLPVVSTLKERSPDKKTGVYPAASVNQGRVPRPLPPPPDGQKAERPGDISTRKKDGQSYKDKSWFHNVNRDQGESLITTGVTELGSLQHNGYFLLRPSGNSAEQPFTLVLWYRNRPFNIPVRNRNDSRFALGSAKPDEQSFASVEEMVDFHKQNELVLYRNGVPVGNTRLTDTPPKRND